MNDEEIRSTIEQIKAQVKAKPENKEKTDDEIDEMILESFFQAYTNGEMSKEDLGGLAQAMGYEFTEEFEKDEEAKPELEGGEEATLPTEDLSKEDLEEVRTIEPGESKEEFKDKIEDVKEGKGVEDEEEVEEDEDDEEAQRKKASELWKMDLSK